MPMTNPRPTNTFKQKVQGLSLAGKLMGSFAVFIVLLAILQMTGILGPVPGVPESLQFVPQRADAPAASNQTDANQPPASGANNQGSNSAAGSAVAKASVPSAPVSLLPPPDANGKSADTGPQFLPGPSGSGLSKTGLGFFQPYTAQGEPINPGQSVPTLAVKRGDTFEKLDNPVNMPGNWYVVAEGDTQIGVQLKTGANQLLTPEGRILKPYEVVPNSVVFAPLAPPTSADGVWYQVKEGDTKIGVELKTNASSFVTTAGAITDISSVTPGTWIFAVKGQGASETQASSGPELLPNPKSKTTTQESVQQSLVPIVPPRLGPTQSSQVYGVTGLKAGQTGKPGQSVQTTKGVQVDAPTSSAVPYIVKEGDTQIGLTLRFGTIMDPSGKPIVDNTRIAPGMLIYGAAAPKTNPSQTAPKVVPQAAPKVVPQAAPRVVPQAAPKVVPQAAPKVVPQAAPKSPPSGIPAGGRPGPTREKARILNGKPSVDTLLCPPWRVGCPSSP